MKRVYMICLTIMSCILFSGCYSIGEVITQSAINCANATMACYQLSGASETRFVFTRYNLDESDICRRNKFYDNDKFYGVKMKIARQKATKNGTLEQIEQCLKPINEIIAKENECNTDDADCYNEVSESYLAHQKSLEPKLKNVKFSCSRADEMMEKYGPKFDKDIESYALDLIKFKPIVSKDIMEDIDMANLTKELNKYDLDDRAIQKTLDNWTNGTCEYKMEYYAGDLNKLEGFKRSGALASKISKGYDDFIKQIKRGDDLPNVIIVPYMSAKYINDRLVEIDKNIKEVVKEGKYKLIGLHPYFAQQQLKLAEWIVAKYKYEARLKFLEEK